MNVFELFSCFTKLPVALPEVEGHILESGVVRSIQTIPSPDLAPRVCGGFLRKYEWLPAYGEPGVHAEIYYSKKFDEPQFIGERRLTICKELLHILDGHESTAETRAAVDQLITEICSPLALTMSYAAIQDHLQVWPALCVLVPRDALPNLRELHKAGMSVEALAKIALVPTDYMRTALSPIWEKIVEEGIK